MKLNAKPLFKIRCLSVTMKKQWIANRLTKLSRNAPAINPLKLQQHRLLIQRKQGRVAALDLAGCWEVYLVAVHQEVVKV